jgi:prevent-host-death family protein
MTALEIPAGQFKARCLQLMEQVRTTRRPIVITKRGKPVARLLPMDEAPAGREIFGCMKGTVAIQGDIVGPTGEEWHAEQGILYAGEDED